MPGLDEPIEFPGCPAKYAREPQVVTWLACYAQWRFWKKSPVELGLLTADELDPRYFDAVETVAWAVNKYRPKD